MFFLKDPTNKTEVQNAIAKFSNESSVARRSNMRKRYDFYFDKQEQYLKDQLNEQFKYPDRLKLQLEFYNCTSIIVDELAIIYSKEPIRKVEGNEKDIEIYEDIVEKGNLNLVLQTASKLAKLFKTVLIRVVWRNDQIEFDIITPDIFDVIENKSDPKTPDAILFVNQMNFNKGKDYNNNNVQVSKDPFSESNLIYNYWSKDKNILFTRKNMDVAIKEVDTNPEDKNPYGVLPFLVIRDGYPLNKFFIEGGDDLIKTNEIVNSKLTELNYLTKMQSFSVPVRKGAVGEKQLVLDPSMSIDIPADSDISKNSSFTFVSPEAKITELSADILSRLKRLAIKYKLDPELFVDSAQKASGLSLQIKSIDKSGFIEKDRPFYRIYEKQLFNIIRIVNNYHSDNKISEDADLYVDFKEIDAPVTISERDEHNLLLYNNGIISKSVWVMNENPDIKTEEEAQEYLKNIEEERKKYETDTGFSDAMTVDNQNDNQNDNQE